MYSFCASRRSLAVCAFAQLPPWRGTIDSAIAFVRPPLSLRIDVHLSPLEIERELETLYRRLHRRGDILHALPVLDLHLPGFTVRYREADGEHYLYVEDLKAQRLAGYTVFNRLVELNRRQDRYLRATHSKYAAAYQRRGIATALYRWWLEGERCLISGARQSVAAHALWHALSAQHERIYVRLCRKRLHYLGRQVDAALQGDLHTRMILLGKHWNRERLADALDMAP